MCSLRLLRRLAQKERRMLPVIWNYCLSYSHLKLNVFECVVYRFTAPSDTASLYMYEQPERISLWQPLKQSVVCNSSRSIRLG